MSIQVKLELPMSQAGIDALLRDLRGHGWGTTARQIEEQLPKPTPPEPKGDVLVRDDFGVAWIRHEDGYWCGTPGTTNWLALSRKGGRVYRPVPSTEAVEALVQEFANLEMWRSRFREFARRLLGGDQ